jgi:hypothetical protein
MMTSWRSYRLIVVRGVFSRAAINAMWGVSVAAEEAEGHATGSSGATDETLQVIQGISPAGVDGTTKHLTSYTETANQVNQNLGGSTSTSPRGRAATQPAEDSTIFGRVVDFFTISFHQSERKMTDRRQLERPRKTLNPISLKPNKNNIEISDV